MSLPNILLKRKMLILKKNVGIFLSNYVNRFVNFHKLMKEKHATYPFRILNADRA